MYPNAPGGVISVATANALKVRWPDVCHDGGCQSVSELDSYAFVIICMQGRWMDGNGGCVR